MIPHRKEDLRRKQNSCEHFFVKMRNKPPYYQCVRCLKEMKRDHIGKESKIAVAKTGGEQFTKEEEEGCREAKGETPCPQKP